jgi:hypothetical protein
MTPRWAVSRALPPCPTVHKSGGWLCPVPPVCVVGGRVYPDRPRKKMSFKLRLGSSPPHSREWSPFHTPCRPRGVAVRAAAGKLGGSPERSCFLSLSFAAIRIERPHAVAAHGNGRPCPARGKLECDLSKDSLRQASTRWAASPGSPGDVPGMRPARKPGGRARHASRLRAVWPAACMLAPVRCRARSKSSSVGSWTSRRRCGGCATRMAPVQTSGARGSAFRFRCVHCKGCPARARAHHRKCVRHATTKDARWKVPFYLAAPFYRVRSGKP